MILQFDDTTHYDAYILGFANFLWMTTTTTTTTDGQTDYFTPCKCVRGSYHTTSDR